MRLSSTNLRELKEQGLSAKLTPAKPRKKRNNEESRMQQAVVRWWRGYAKEHNIPECLLFAIPNGSALGHGREEHQVKQRQIRGSIMKREGLRPGCPDLFLAIPTFFLAGGNFTGMFIEMKTAKGVVEPEQVQFMNHLGKHHYRVMVCRTAEEAIQSIETYLT